MLVYIELTFSWVGAFHMHPVWCYLASFCPAVISWLVSVVGNGSHMVSQYAYWFSYTTYRRAHKIRHPPRETTPSIQPQRTTSQQWRQKNWPKKTGCKYFPLSSYLSGRQFSWLFTFWVWLYAANMRRYPNVGLLLAHRPRRWPNSKPTLGQHLIFAGFTGTHRQHFDSCTARLHGSPHQYGAIRSI